MRWLTASWHAPCHDAGTDRARVRRRSRWTLRRDSGIFLWDDGIRPQSTSNYGSAHVPEIVFGRPRRPRRLYRNDTGSAEGHRSERPRPDECGRGPALDHFRPEHDLRGLRRLRARRSDPG